MCLMCGNCGQNTLLSNPPEDFPHSDQVLLTGTSFVKGIEYKTRQEEVIYQKQEQKSKENPG